MEWRRGAVNGVCTSIYQQPERSIPKHLPASDASQDAAPPSPPPAVAALPALPPHLAPLPTPARFTLLLLSSAAAAAAYLTWISASGWRLTSAKIMREMWSNSSSSSRAAAGIEPGCKSMASALCCCCPRRLCGGD